METYNNIFKKIVERLDFIEKEKDIKILYAVESGSRGWGFASIDSDYDVRFIYIHRIEWYLSISEKRDVLEFPVNESLDISGWEIRKSLRLFKKSNPPLLEWLRSPVIYMERYGFAQRLRELINQYFSPLLCLHHYLHMAEGNYRDYLKGDLVKTKKYFYVLRPILACKWVEREGTMPPMEFNVLLETQVEDARLKDEIFKLLNRKKEGEELGYEPPIKIINDFLDAQIRYYSDYVKTMKKNTVADAHILDEMFRDTLEMVWK